MAPQNEVHRFARCVSIDLTERPASFSIGQAHKELVKLKEDGGFEGRVPPQEVDKVAMSTQAAPAFEKAARVRNITSAELIARILDIISHEPSLINAILDDGETTLES
jgi:hypothetical protein